MRKLLVIAMWVFATIVADYSFGQTIHRSVISSAGETFQQNQISISYVLGEGFSDLLSDNNSGKYLSLGFLQPDNDVQTLLANYSNEFILYPNPVTGGATNIAFNHVVDGTYNIQIFNTIGQLMNQKIVTYYKGNFFYYPVDVSNLSSGTYFIVISNGNSLSQLKLLKL